MSVVAVVASLACACASSEDVGDGPPGSGSGGGDVDAGGSGGSGNEGGGGSSGIGNSGGFPTDSGFPGGAAGTTGTGGGSGTGGSCGAEVCNGVDDDCDGTPDNGGVCSPGCSGQKFDNHGYSFCATQSTLSVAAEDCIAQNMKPARPNDAQENDWLRSTATSLAMGAVWLGATDWTTEGNWEWPDGTAFWTGGHNGSPVGSVYTNWGSTEPVGKDASDCMQMGVDGTWHEVACGGKVAYICEDY